MKNNTKRKQGNTDVKNLKRQLMTKDFLWRLKLHVGNWNESMYLLSEYQHNEITRQLTMLNEAANRRGRPFVKMSVERQEVGTYIIRCVVY